MSRARVAVLQVVSNQLTVTAAAGEHGISRRHLQRLLARYREGGLDALEPRSRRPKTTPIATPDDIRERVIALRVQLAADGLDAGPHTIAWHLEREGQLRISTSLPSARRQWMKSDWLDDHSRYLLSASVHAPVTGDDVVSVFLGLVEEFGAPQSTLTDNGRVYTARFGGGRNAFEYLLPLLGIQQKNGSPGHPQTQGKVERFHQTLQRWLRSRPPARTPSELQNQLDEFRTHYNERRPHRALQRRTPGEAYRATPKALPASNGHGPGHYRLRYDRLDVRGKMTLRRAGRMHYLHAGIAHAGKRVLAFADDRQVTVAELSTGAVLSVHLIDPRRAYWRNQNKAPGRWPGSTE